VENTVIANYNDMMRAAVPMRLNPKDRVVMTRGVACKEPREVADIWMKVKKFKDFTPGNDPHGEHDFGAFDYKGEKIFWKIDNYDGQEGLNRVLTVMLAEDY